ncbi:MAG: TlpA family protein disulfide reductase [Deltaproteobacteria bacterium]|nr:TlpA family protein disulfide reductase [Deltaproteobacteria bacterium]
MRNRYLVSLIILLLFTVFFGCTAKDEGEPLPAANFSLPDLDGRTVSLSDYQGQVVLVNFWATWCYPCREEIPDFIELQNEYAARGFTILGISIDTADMTDVKKFATEFKINYPVLYAGKEAKQLMRDYGNVRGIPTSFLIDHNGLQVKKVIGLMQKSFWKKEIKAALKKAEKS